MYDGPSGLNSLADKMHSMEALIRARSEKVTRNTGAKAKVLASKVIRERVSLKKQYVDSKLYLRGSGDEVVLEAKKRGILISRYDYTVVHRKGKKDGYRIKVAAKGGSSLFRHLFPVKLKNGNGIGLAQRIGKGYNMVYAPSVSQELNWGMEGIADAVMETHKQDMINELNKL
jgi:hypothetical protein